MFMNNKKITKKMIINVLIFSSILGIIAGIIEQFEQDIERKKHPENIPYLNHIYEKFIKRPLDVVLAFWALVVFSPIIFVVAILVHINLGTPVFFIQKRPGKNEKLFKILKFRTMNSKTDGNGNFLPDSIRLTRFGKLLCSTSLDELPELINIIKGDMAIIGPRPQLVKDMVFMTYEQRRRHLIRPGLSGLAQVRGRNAITWEEKLNLDLEYMKNITFWGDIKIIVQTIINVFKCKNISQEGQATALDYGDYLLETGKIKNVDYTLKLEEAKKLLNADK